MGSLKDVKYDAFISYRHSEFDSFVVENLHKKLENFKLPKSVLKKVKNGRTRINRVFRDVDELPLADNLSEPINDALRNSDYLITVCTPRYPQSRWCMKEIETFLETHTRDHILVVLVLCLTDLLDHHLVTADHRWRIAATRFHIIICIRFLHCLFLLKFHSIV